jgi:replicative DNA helicase
MNTSEQALIQASLLNNDGAMAVNIGADEFSTDVGQRLWQEISKLLTMTGSADGVSLQDALSGDQGCLIELGNCMGITCSPKQIHAYAGIVKRDAKRRSLQSVAQGIIDDGDTDPDELSGRLMSELIGGQAGDKKSDYSAQELMAKTIERIDSASEGGQLGLKTGWRSIDQKLGGWHQGDLTIVAGRPGMGKSALGMNAAVNAAKLGAKVGFISVEMDAVSLGMRLAASAACISVSDLRRGNLSPQDWEQLARASREIAALPLRVLDAPSWTMGQIVRQCHAWHRMGLDMVVIDYLQRTKPDIKTDRHDLAIGQMAKDCKTMAAVLEIPVLLLSQLSRNLEQRQDKRPNMSDLRESGQIEQEADNILMLYRDAVYNETADERDAEVLVEKQRQGPVGMIPMIWHGERALWLDGNGS